MGKRGLKAYEESSDKAVPMRLIAKNLKISDRAAWYTYKNALKRLKTIPGAFSILLDCVHAVGASERDPLQCASAECDREFIALYSDRSDIGRPMGRKLC